MGNTRSQENMPNRSTDDDPKNTENKNERVKEGTFTSQRHAGVLTNTEKVRNANFNQETDNDRVYSFNRISDPCLSVETIHTIGELVKQNAHKIDKIKLNQHQNDYESKYENSSKRSPISINKFENHTYDESNSKIKPLKITVTSASTINSISYSNEDKEKIKNIVCKKLNQRNRDGYIGLFSSIHEDIVCDVCSKSDFLIDRYKCLTCRNYNLCGKCYEERKFNGRHLKEHPMVRFSGPNELFGEPVHPICVDYKSVVKTLEGVQHEFSSCNWCGCEKIIGPRFKCDECIDFNLCIECYERKKEKGRHKSDHCILVYDSLTNIKSNDLKIMEELGKGSYGTVYKAKLIPKSKIVACKIIEYKLEDLSSNLLNENELSKSFDRESRAYNEINSNFVLKIYGCFIETSKSLRKFYILTEYMEKGCLFEVIEKEKDLSYRLRLSMACNIASGLRRIHDKKFIHRDIRPHNILVNKDYTAKICDMGLAKIQDPSELNSVFGCVPYMPKEFFTRKFTEKLDIFTFGLTIYHLFTGIPHVYDRRLNEIKLNAALPVFSEFINKCLNDIPSSRPSAKSLDERLSFHHEVLLKAISNQKDYAHFDKELRKEFFIKVYNLTVDILKDMHDF